MSKSFLKRSGENTILSPSFVLEKIKFILPFIESLSLLYIKKNIS
jgi:hypothetical protein